MASRITVDPITRIEGHLRIEVEVSGGKVVNAWSSGQMFRGIELILQGRDPRDLPELVAQPADDGFAEEVAKAERLARIVVSDIILYNPEKFEAAVRAGNVVEAMAGEIAEGRSLFVGRIDVGETVFRRAGGP